MSGEREPNRPPVLVRFAVGALAKSYEDLRSWTDQVRDDISRLPDEIKKIPVNLASLPVQAVTDAVSSAIRLQQNFNALVIKGDETLDLIFHKPEEQPAWATFDEDEELAQAEEAEPPAPAAPPEPAQTHKPAAPRSAAATSKPTASKPAAPKPVSSKPAAPKPPASKPRAEKPEAEKPAAPNPPASQTGAPKLAAPGRAGRPELVDYLEYEGISLAQLRARARNLSVPELRELLAYERAHGNRPPFVTLLENRITTSGA